ncbi:Putative zinc transporter msc2 [Rhodotorula toruloides]
MSAGYMEAYDPRVSRRVSLSHISRIPRDASSLPSDLLFALLLSKGGVALALHASRDWLLAQGYPAVRLTALVLAVAGGALMLWERPWAATKGGKRRTEPPNPVYPLVLFLDILFALSSISRLSVLRFILLTSFAPLWARAPPFVKIAGRRAGERGNTFAITTAMVVLSYLADSTLSRSASRSGYLCLLAHLLAVGYRSELYAAHNGDEQQRSAIHANSTVAAAIGASVLAVLQAVFTSSTKTSSPSPSDPFFPAPDSSFSLHLLVAAFLAITHLCIDPLLTRTLLTHIPPVRLLRPGWPLTAVATAFIGYIGFGKAPGLSELAVALIAWRAIRHIASTDPRSTVVPASGGVSTGSSSPDQPFLTRLATFYRHFRATIKTILASPESRRIYFFLCLNLAFMFVQMAYGIWTNSLGLISDSIHMFFDCLALAMGLFASVMATWPSNSVYTYGYSRVETLSGFANGIFLCLISIFIVFEAIQRLIDPPEMNTGQLLTVSAVGLAVNLVGLLATGGHHGHSHGSGGGHGHGHGHSHAPVRSNSTPFLVKGGEDVHADHHGHSRNGHSHSSHTAPPTRSSHNRSHSHASPAPPLSHLASPSPSQHHSHSHSHSHASSTPTARGHSHDAHNGHGGHDEHGDCESDDEDEGGAESAHAHDSHNMKGVFLHVMADTLGSVGVIISTLLINRYGWTGFDPLASIFIAVMIFVSVIQLVVDSGRLLVLDMGEEKEAEVRKALTALGRVEGVASFTKPRFWQKDPSSMVGSICIQLAPASGSAYDAHGRPTQFHASIDRVHARVRRVLRSHIAGLDDLTIQVEPTGGLG